VQVERERGENVIFSPSEHLAESFGRSATSRRTLKPGASFSQGVRLILRHVTVTFSTPQTQFVLQDKRAKERKNA